MLEPKNSRRMPTMKELSAVSLFRSPLKDKLVRVIITIALAGLLLIILLATTGILENPTSEIKALIGGGYVLIISVGLFAVFNGLFTIWEAYGINYVERIQTHAEIMEVHDEVLDTLEAYKQLQYDLTGLLKRIDAQELEIVRHEIESLFSALESVAKDEHLEFDLDEETVSKTRQDAIEVFSEFQKMAGDLQGTIEKSRKSLISKHPAFAEELDLT